MPAGVSIDEAVAWYARHGKPWAVWNLVSVERTDDVITGSVRP